MENKMPSNAIELLDRAETALVRAAVPVPAETLIHATTARVLAQAVQLKGIPGSGRKQWRKMPMVRRSTVAASFALVATAAIFFVLAGRGATIAFADVVAQTRAAKSVRYSVTKVSEPSQTNESPEPDEILIAAGGWMVLKMGEEGRLIFNSNEGKGIVLNSRHKEAELLDAARFSAKETREFGLIRDVSQLDPKDGKPAGEEEIDGTKTRKFELDKEMNGAKVHMELWADAGTGRLVQVKIKTGSATMPSATTPSVVQINQFLVFKNFDWDPKFDPSELTLDVPNGYRSHNHVDLSAPPEEKDVIAMLQQFEEFNNGQFPDALDVQSFDQAIRNQLIAASAQADAARVAPDQRGNFMQNIMGDIGLKAHLMSRGFAFIRDSNAGTDWHYSGKGAQLGEKDKPILWYKSKGSETYHVINADLTVHEQKAANLPKADPLETDWPQGPGFPTPVIPGLPPASRR